MQVPISSHAATEAAGRWLVRLLLAAAVAVVFVPLVLTFYLSVFDEALIGFRGGEASIGKRGREALVREQKRA